MTSLAEGMSSFDNLQVTTEQRGHACLTIVYTSQGEYHHPYLMSTISHITETLDMSIQFSVYVFFC